MRIRYQSFIDPEEDPQYTSLLQSYLDSLAGPNVSYEVVGMVPPDKKLHRISEYRCGAHVIRGAVQARDDGFDAYAIGHFQDGGLGEARSAIDLPVTGLGEASLLFGCSLGRTIGLITINPLFIPWHEEQVAAYGLRERVGAVRSLETTPSIFMDACTDDSALGQLLADFKAESARLAEQDRPHRDLPARVPGGARRVHLEHGALKAQRWSSSRRRGQIRAAHAGSRVARSNCSPVNHTASVQPALGHSHTKPTRTSRPSWSASQSWMSELARRFPSSGLSARGLRWRRNPSFIPTV